MIDDQRDSASRNAWLEVTAEPDRTSSSRGTVIGVGALVGLLVVAVLVLRGRPAAAGLAAAVVLALTAARALVPAVDRGALRIIGSIGRAIGSILTWFLCGAIVVVVIVPVWAITRLAWWDTLRFGPRGPGRWQATGLRPWEQAPTRMFGHEPRNSPRRRIHGIAIGVGAVSLLLLAALPAREWVARDRSAIVGYASNQGGATSANSTAGVADMGEWDVRGDAPSQHGLPLITESEPWAIQYLATRLEIFEFDPNLSVRLRDAHSRWFNVENRVRRSWEPPAGPNAIDVWFFGSSQLLGHALIRDDHTIPSELAQLAWREDQIPIRASNFGVSGYETWQQVMLMAQMLTERPPPDLVVFYGGYNDLHHYMSPGAPTSVSSTWAMDFANALQDAGADIAPTDPAHLPQDNGWSPENAARVYDRGIRTAQDLLSARRIPFVNYLQPCLCTRDRPEDDATLDSIDADREWLRSFGAVYDAARAEITSEVVDLSDALDSLPGVVYWDEVHHNEAGDKAVAAAAYPHLRQQLLRVD